MEWRPINTFVSRLVKDTEVMGGSLKSRERERETDEENAVDRHLFFSVTANPHPFIPFPQFLNETPPPPSRPPPLHSSLFLPLSGPLPILPCPNFTCFHGNRIKRVTSRLNQRFLKCRKYYERFWVAFLEVRDDTLFFPLPESTRVPPFFTLRKKKSIH